MLLRSTSDLLRVVTSAAADIEVGAWWADYDPSQPVNDRVTVDGDVPTNITTATTVTVVPSPGSGVKRKVKYFSAHNAHASTACGVRVELFDGTDAAIVANCLLAAGESVSWSEGVGWRRYNTDKVLKESVPLTLFNQSVAAQGAGFSSDTYLTGSFIVFPIAPKVGTKYKCRFSVSKTAAGTATPIITVRVGTAGTTGDTGRGTHTFSAGTAATDVGWFEVTCVFRTVGSGTNAVLQSHCALTSQPTTGFSSLLKGTQATSGGFDSTASPGALGIGVSVNGGTSASWTVQLVVAELENAL